MSESFTFDVGYSTTFDQIEELRQLMLAFLKLDRRDYMPVFDVTVVDIPGQEKMTLRADIKYKSNWQQGALKAKRRNKWICALKSSLAKVKIYGPDGNPDAKPSPTPYTLVPYEDIVKREMEEARMTFEAAQRALSSPNVSERVKIAAEECLLRAFQQR